MMYSPQSPFSALPHPPVSVSASLQSFQFSLPSQPFQLPISQPPQHASSLPFQPALYQSPHPQTLHPTPISEIPRPLPCQQVGSVQYEAHHVALSQANQLDSAAIPAYSTHDSSNPQGKCPDSDKSRMGDGEEDGEGDDYKRKEKEHKKRSKNWTRFETLKLIRLRTELEPRFAKGAKKSELWDEIAEVLQQDLISRDAQQCRDKWEKLAATYKGARDGIRDRQGSPFYHELHPLLSGKASAKEREREKDPNEAGEAEIPNPLPCETARDSVVSDAENNAEKRSRDFRDEEDCTVHVGPAKGKKRKRPKYISVSDLSAVQELIQAVLEKQQELFRGVLEIIERKAYAREQARQENEERWRAEERAQRNIFNNTMMILTQKLLREGEGDFSAGLPVFPIASADGNQVLKKRSSNWKRAEVLQLIQLRGEMDSRFCESTRRGLLWDELAELLMAHGIKRDAKQCREKWDKLMAEYKEVVDDRKEASLSPYFSELRTIRQRQNANAR